MSEIYVRVALPIPLRKTFDYRVPDSMRGKIARGKRVSVPFKDYERKGFVVDVYEDIFREGVKDIIGVIEDETEVPENMLKLCEFLSEEFFLPIGQLLRMVISPWYEPGKEGREKEKSEEKITIPELEERDYSEVLKRLRNGLTLVISGEREKRYALYLILARKMKELGKKTIIAFPEKLKASFFFRIEKKELREALIHSSLSPLKRGKELEKILKGEVDIVIGTPSILFAPLNNVGLIIVDEEESRYHKLEENPRFHSKWVAEKRAEIEGCSLIYGTSHPSVETYFKVLKKEFRILEIPSRKKLKIEIIKEKTLFPPEVLSATGKNIKKGAQAVFLTVRKGIGGIIFCRKCSWLSICPRCKLPLKLHEEGEQICHICGWREPLRLYCPKCRGKLSFIGAIGTEKIFQILRERFPRAKLAILDLEKTRTRKMQREIWQKFFAKKIDLLVGTQLILSSSETFCEKTDLLVIVKPEVNLSLPDVNFSEENFHLINSAIEIVKDGGRAFIISEFPRHHSIRWLLEGEKEVFYREELKTREMLGYPPFGMLIKLTISRKTLKGVGKISRSIFGEIKEKERGIEIVGPSITPFSDGKGKSVRIIIKGGRERLKEWLKENIPTLEKSRVEIDINPLSLL
ncbi:MAG: replication restart helicase PriA [Candidatus Aminicenantia bacterium]